MQNTSKPTTPREYFYSIDTRGNLVHDGAIVDDDRFLKRFFTALHENTGDHLPEFPFVALCGPEHNYLRAADTPIVFQYLDQGRLFYAPECSVEFDARKLRFSQTSGVLYHEAPVGGFGRLQPSLAVELARDICSWGPWFAFKDHAHNMFEVIEPLQATEGLRLLRPREANQCVGCGRDSTNGLKLSFLYDENQRSVQSWFLADDRLMGSLNIMHGGFVALLLDETMGKILGALGVKAPTAQLNVRYRRPVPIGKELLLQARLESAEGRKHHLHGEICLAEDPETVLAESSALFIRINTNN